ncbi:MAG TPA: DHHA1 domain-containing protein [Pseudomonas sp.]
MKTLCIYHANCADGFGAAWVVRQALGAENVEFHAGHYGKPAPDVEGRDVIIVDFSYPYHLLVLLGHQARSLLVIDHHKTAAEDLALPPFTPAPATFSEWATSTQRVGTVFDMERSGAGLTWDYFNPGQPRPALINHIEDRDLWRFKLEGTREIMANVFSYPHDFAAWDWVMNAPIDDHLSRGLAIERKHHKDLAELTGSNTRLTSIAGYSVPTINLPPTMASDAGHQLSEGQPFAAIYWDTAEHRKYSLRSRPEGLDVSEIAKQFGGGGHRNAAGFTVPFDHELVTGYVPATLEQTEDLDESVRGNIAYSAVIDYMLNAGRGEEPMEFLRNWNEGNFDTLRREWPDAPIAIYYADPLADHKAIDASLRAEQEGNDHAAV